METVLNHNITQEEWSKIIGVSRERYSLFLTADSANSDLASLYYIRGDVDKAREYASKLPDGMRIDLWRLLTHH